MSKLLIHEAPLVVIPSLASKIGLNEAIILQQIHYWLNPQVNKNYKNNRYWVYNTYAEWKKQFPFWSEVTIKRTISNLEKMRLIISENYNKNSFNKTKWYSINYDELRALEVLQNSEMDQIDPFVSTQSLEGADQSDQLDRSKCSSPQIKMIRSYIETENTTKNNKETFSLNGVQTKEKLLLEREMINLWNKIIYEDTQEVTLTPTRKKHLSVILVKFFNNDIKKWEELCKEICSSKFLMGEITTFRVNIDWILKEENLLKVIENAYKTNDRVINSNLENSISEIIIDGNTEEVKRFKTNLLLSLGKKTYISWFNKVEIIDNGESLILNTPTKFFKEHIKQNFIREIEGIYKSIFGNNRKLIVQ